MTRIPPDGHLPRDELERRISAYVRERNVNPLFSGSSTDLPGWFIIMENLCFDRNIPATQRTEVAVLRIRPDTPLAPIMEERQRLYIEQSSAGYWPWDGFKEDIEAVLRAVEESNHGDGVDWGRVGRTGIQLAQGAMFIPLIAIAGINLVGFTAGGVAAGSIAAGIQSMVYGGATGGVFSILQSIGATATLEVPAILAGASAVSKFLGLRNANEAPAHPSNEGDEPHSSQIP